jgi:pantoate--beta-alanine ligase
MNRIICKNELRKWLRSRSNASIGFVPTMGALHEGHLSLIEQSKRDNDITVCSIYVNPTQFAANEDLDRYPRPIERDLQLLRRKDVDLAFTPLNLYSDGDSDMASVRVRTVHSMREAQSRPQFFDGVATVVAKLLNLVSPSALYVGQKDFAQSVVIRRLVDDLDFACRVHVVDTVRESDGLAMSSRNRYLGDNERCQAPALFASLGAIASLYANDGERRRHVLVDAAQRVLASDAPLFRLDYIDFADTQTAASIGDTGTVPDANVNVAIAGHLHQTRLIDNMNI